MSSRPLYWISWLATLVAMTGCGEASTPSQAPSTERQVFDLVIRNGTLYDGAGGEPRKGDVGVVADRIVAVGDLSQASGNSEIDAAGLAVAPGFIDVISFSWDVWPVDSRALSNVYQGVTMELFCEGESPGPLTPELRELMKTREFQYRFDVPWTTLGEYLDYLENKGTGVNFASLIGNSNVRRMVLGESSRAPSPAELLRMQEVVRQAMDEGAFGLGTGLSTPPGSFSSRDELVALARVVAEYDGLLEMALRSQSNQVLEAVDEALDVARRSGARMEIGHVYQSGRENWPKIDAMIAKIEAAQQAGQKVTASIYPYTEAWTYLSSALPPWVHDGGWPVILARLDDPKQRARIAREMQNWRGGDASGGWEQYLALADSPEGVVFLRVEAESLKKYQGRTLADFMRERGETSKEMAVLNLIRENRNEVSTVFRTQSEANMKRFLAKPWVSMGSDASSMATEGVHLEAPVHPRTYGSAARILGKYVRDEKILSLQEAVRRLTALPAANLGIKDRGALKAGYFADLAVFDPATVRDVSTFANSHQYAQGMRYVFVNGVSVLSEGKHTGKLPGRAVRGPGWKP